MDLREYTRIAKEFRIYDDKYAVIYPLLGLAGETGELLNKVKKALRDNNGVISEEMLEAIKLEMGDILWYFCMLASDLGLDIYSVAKDNITKLAERRIRNLISGSGDNR